jgi:hypothetical protein
VIDWPYLHLPVHCRGPASVGEIAALTVAANAKVNRASAKIFFMIFPLTEVP